MTTVFYVNGKLTLAVLTICPAHTWQVIKIGSRHYDGDCPSGQSEAQLLFPKLRYVRLRPFYENPRQTKSKLKIIGTLTSYSGYNDKFNT